MKTAILNPAALAAAIIVGSVFNNGLAVAQCPTNITTQTLTFDDVSPYEYVIISNGYGGLQWNNFFIQNGSRSPGFYRGAVSQPNVAFDGLGAPASISSDALFTLRSAYLTAVYVNSQQISVQGFRNGSLIYNNTYDVNDNAPTLINFNYVGVDRVTFAITQSFDGVFAMDNLVISNLATVLPDSDGDGVPDCLDQCPDTPAGEVVDEHGCSIDQLVPCDGPKTGGLWNNHGQYVSAIAAAANAFLAAGRITADKRDAIVQAAAHSDCGKPSHPGQGPPACPPSFAPAVNFGAGTHLNSAAAGDFNGDGKLDLVVVNDSSNSVAVLLGNGDGSFQPAVNYSAGLYPSFAAVGDFNGDGKPDLAVANGGSTNVSVLLGDCDGTFQSTVNYAVGSSPRFVAVSDFNGDGKPDLAVANAGNHPFSNGNIAILLGNGDGTFRPAVTYPAGLSPHSIAVADLNKDGHPDLVVVDAYSANVLVLLGRGDGTFQPAVQYRTGHYPQSVAVGDFNGDGNPDLAVANLEPGDRSVFTSITVLMGNGDGTFRVTAKYRGTGGYSVVAADFNGDGKADLAVADSGSISILLGNGDGRFQSAMNFGAGGGFGHSVVAGDFNGDGKPDVAVATATGGSVLLNTSPCAGLHLDVVPSKSNITLSWPLPYANFVLECAASPASTNWQTVVGTLATNNGHCEVTVPPDQARCYFRLRKADAGIGALFPSLVTGATNGYITALLRSECTSAPSSPPPVGGIRVGPDYVIMTVALGDREDWQRAQQLASDAVFESLMPLYCALSGHARAGCVGDRVQWNVELYDAAGNPAVSGCAASGCEFRYFTSPCSVAPPEQIQFLMTWVNVDVTAGILDKCRGDSLIAKLNAALENAANANARAAINELQAFLNELSAIVQTGRLSAAAQTLIDGATTAIAELGG